MDVAVFYVLKTFWRQKVHEWKIEHIGEQLKKHHFAPVLKEVLPLIKYSAIVNGFKKYGLVPWNPKNVVVEQKSSTESSTVTMNHDKKVLLLILEREIGAEKMDPFIKAGRWFRRFILL